MFTAVPAAAGSRSSARLRGQPAEQPDPQPGPSGEAAPVSAGYA
jgi:hypothetical protein